MKKRKCVKLVAVCKELYIKEEKFELYFIEEENTIFKAGNYLYKRIQNEDTVTFSIIYVQEIRKYRKNEDHILKMDDNMSFVKVDDSLFFELKESAIIQLETLNVREINKIIRKSIVEIKRSLSYYSYSLNEERIKYLKYIYCFANYEDFETLNKRSKENLLRKINSIDLDYYLEINIYRMKDILIAAIDKNSVLNNIDKMAVKNNCIDRLEIVFLAIEPNGNAKRQMDSYIGVDVDYKRKELVWGKTSPCEVRIEFSFFWSLIKNILSLIYVPAILLLLDNKYKIFIYALLIFVYLIALIFSEERQTDKLIEAINKNGANISYGTLYYGGMMVSIVFILFSIEMILVPKCDLKSIIQYILANIVSAFTVIIVFNSVLSFIVWGITKCSATKFYQQKWNNVKNMARKLVTTILFTLGTMSAYSMLNVKEFILNDNVNLKFIIFFLTALASIFNIMRVWFDKNE